MYNQKILATGDGAGTYPLSDAMVTRPEFKNFLATNEGRCVAMAEGYHIASGGELGVAIVPKPGLFDSAIDRAEQPVCNRICNIEIIVAHKLKTMVRRMMLPQCFYKRYFVNPTRFRQMVGKM